MLRARAKKLLCTYPYQFHLLEVSSSWGNKHPNGDLMELGLR